MAFKVIRFDELEMILSFIVALFFFSMNIWFYIDAFIHLKAYRIRTNYPLNKYKPFHEDCKEEKEEKEFEKKEDKSKDE